MARKAKARPRPAIAIRSLAQAEAALVAAREAGVAIELWSAAAAAAAAGAGWFDAVARAAAARVPGAEALAVLDCGPFPGYALGAFRLGVPAVCFTGGAKVAAKLAEIAAASGCEFRRRRPPHILELGRGGDPLGPCRAWLAAAKGPGRR